MGVWGFSLVAEHVLSMCEPLDLIPRTSNKTKQPLTHKSKWIQKNSGQGTSLTEQGSRSTACWAISKESEQGRAGGHGCLGSGPLHWAPISTQDRPSITTVLESLITSPPAHQYSAHSAGGRLEAPQLSKFSRKAVKAEIC
jgi:hypothetical protein